MGKEMEEGNAEFGEMTSTNGPTLVVLELPRGSLSTELGGVVSLYTFGSTNST